ncbi:MAG TPA: hypothetical protein DEP66_07535, partial [Acidimicrobiaceae bacterium]|nr:hypothetical protein [Acidimicrobiaceae bacterium]
HDRAETASSAAAAPAADEDSAAEDSAAAEQAEQAASTTAAPASTASPATTSPAPPDACSAGATAVTGDATLASGGNDYDYHVFVPPGYTPVPTPLVLNFHGLGSDGAGQAGFSNYQGVAVEEGFVVVHPTGLIVESSGDRRSWELPQLPDDERDDVGFVRDLIAEVGRQVCVDAARVYATGMSNGGFLSSVLACEMADTFAATFSVAAVTHPDGCTPSRPIAMGAVHGTADEVVPYSGGGGSTLIDTADESFDAETLADFFSQVMPEEMAEFAADFDCGPAVDTTVGPDTTLRTWSDCDGGVELVFYTVEGGGHTWPGSMLARAYAAQLGYATDDVDAARDGWAFMSRFTLERDEP